MYILSAVQQLIYFDNLTRQQFRYSRPHPLLPQNAHCLHKDTCGRDLWIAQGRVHRYSHSVKVNL